MGLYFLTSNNVNFTIVFLFKWKSEHFNWGTKRGKRKIVIGKQRRKIDAQRRQREAANESSLSTIELELVPFFCSFILHCRSY